MKRSISKRSPIAACLILICGLVFLSAPAWAGKDTPFSAEHVTFSPDGKQQMKSMIYYTTGKYRMEMNMPTGPTGKMIVISLKKEMKMIMINPQKKLYFEMPLEKDQWPGEEKDVKKEKIGSEKVSGYNCTKYAVVREMNMMGRNDKIKLTSWESDKFTVPLRTKTEKGGIQELRNIKEGRPPASVFEIPSGYKKVDNMMQMMAP